MLTVKECGNYSMYWSGEENSASVGKMDFIGIYNSFIDFAGDPWICSMHSDSGLIGYVVGFNIEKESASLEITLKSARGSVRIFKTIDAAFAFLLSCKFDSAVINYG
jgi:hypothetical protein